MYNYTVSIIVSFFAMSFVGTSYFTKKKSLYLTLQALGIIFLILSYFFTEKFLPMIAQVIAFTRTYVFFWYEKKNKLAPLGLAFLFSSLSISAFIILNVIIMKNATIWDILYVISLCLYTFSFRIRNLKVMRYVLLAPNGLSTFYNFIIKAPIFATISYAFELLANIVSIIKYNFIGRRIIKKK